MTTATQQTTQSAIECPDDDGEPMSDNEAERRRADEERQRAERYAAKLRELGIEPD
jgi:hypothetical protein